MITRGNGNDLRDSPIRCSCRASEKVDRDPHRSGHCSDGNAGGRKSGSTGTSSRTERNKAEADCTPNATLAVIELIKIGVVIYVEGCEGNPDRRLSSLHRVLVAQYPLFVLVDPHVVRER